MALEQVFVILLLNAAQAMPNGDVEANVIALDVGRDGDMVERVTVRDNGRGIAADHLRRIFDPFFTTKPAGEGTGLGLAITHTIVTQLGGTIPVASEVGKGTGFRVRLPVAVAPARSVTPFPRRAVRRARILIVDDEPTLVRTLVTLLSEEHDVVGATSGADALGILMADQTFDLVLCDLMMPYVTGMDLYERLAKERPGLEKRLAFMTGGAFTARARDFLRDVTNPRVDKPFSPAMVTDILNAMVAGK
ncbi:MAG: ATP-binding protein [Polyangiaceae bacterium]